VYLSKSQYLRGLQCHKSLWLYRHRRELMTPPDAAREAVFAVGHEVGKLAQRRFPGGVEIALERDNFDAMCARTAELIEQGARVIYEATFVRDGLLAMVDILVKNDDAWDFFEVKSSTRVKPVHLPDAAIQWHILDAQLELGRAHIMHIDTRYRRSGALDLDRLFLSVDVTAEVTQLQPGLPASVQSMQSMLADAEPDIAIGQHCKNPYECDFKAWCWRAVPKPSVFDLYKLPGERKFELFRRGLVRYADLRGQNLSAAQALQIDTAASGEAHVDRQGLGEFLAAARYPLHFLDFETLMHAVPRFDDQRPYQQIPFQYSLHILHADGELEHREFLAEEGKDPRTAVAVSLAGDLGEHGSIVAYSEPTEKRALGALAEHCPRQAAALGAAQTRFIDLLTPFRQLMYYHPDFNGDLSIKSVLPAMLPNDPEADYAGLEISDGRTAMRKYDELAQIDDEGERRKARDALRDYCRLDTLAMVRIWQELLRLAR